MMLQRKKIEAVVTVAVFTYTSRSEMLIRSKI